MVDMDEFLFIVKDNLKNYLLNKRFEKCDFIKINWVIAKDNNLLNFDNRSLFERFKGPYIKTSIIKSIIRGNIENLIYSVHSPKFSPLRNISCNSIGKIINNYKSERNNDIKNMLLHIWRAKFWVIFSLIKLQRKK